MKWKIDISIYAPPSGGFAFPQAIMKNHVRDFAAYVKFEKGIKKFIQTNI